MIDYEQLGLRLSKVFDTEIKFENNKDSFLITRDTGIPAEKSFIRGFPTYSSEFTFAEKRCNFIICFEVGISRKTHYKKVVADMNNLFKIYGIGVTEFTLHEAIGKLWIKVEYTLILPHGFLINIETFTAEVSLHCLLAFRALINGFSSFWK